MANQLIGFEITRNIIDRVGINNLVEGSAIAEDVTLTRATGVENAKLGNTQQGFAVLLLEGEDRVEGTAEAISKLEEAVADGIFNADKIKGFSNAVTEGNRKNTIATGINSTDGSILNSGSTRDLFLGKASAEGQDNVGAFGILTTNLNSGSGNDSVRGNSTAQGVSTADARGISIGFSDIDEDTIANPENADEAPTANGEAQVGKLVAGDGNDLLEGTADVTVTAQDGDEIFFAGANGIIIDGGTLAELTTLLAEIGKDLTNFDRDDIEQILPQLKTSTLDTGSGRDLLIAEVTLNASQDGDGADDDLEIIGDGLENAGNVLLGDGNDSVNSTVTVNSEIEGAKGLADALDNGSVGIVTGLGLETNDEALFDLGAGDDTFTSNISATAVNDLSAADGLGNEGIFVAGAGNDRFDLTSRSKLVLQNEDDGEQQEVEADGWDNRNQVFLDDPEGLVVGNDSVTTSATTFGEGVLTIAAGLESRKFFDAGGGDDSFDLTGSAITGVGALADNLTQATGLQTEQADSGEFLLGEGNNYVSANAMAASEAVADAEYTPSTFAFGITQMSASANNAEEAGKITAGSGSDTLEGTSNAAGKEDVVAFGSLFSNANLGDGKNNITGDATATGNSAIANGISVGTDEVFLKNNSLGRDYGLEAEAGILSTGNDNDSIEATATAEAIDGSASASAISQTNGEINLGGGNDIIIAEAFAKSNNSFEAIAISGGTINAGDGADEIRARSNDLLIGAGRGLFDGSQFALDGGRGFGADVQINLGAGNDTLQGFGEGIVDGGTGTDTLKFEFSLLEFIIGGGSIDRSGNFTYGGVTYSTSNFERFEFDTSNNSLSVFSALDNTLQNNTFNSIEKLVNAAELVEASIAENVNFVLRGSSSDTFFGSASNDVLVGGDGDDILHVNFSNEADFITEN